MPSFLYLHMPCHLKHQSHHSSSRKLRKGSPLNNTWDETHTVIIKQLHLLLYWSLYIWRGLCQELHSSMIGVGKTPRLHLDAQFHQNQVSVLLQFLSEQRSTFMQVFCFIWFQLYPHITKQSAGDGATWGLPYCTGSRTHDLHLIEPAPHISESWKQIFAYIII